MSKLANKIKNAGRVKTTPIGFGVGTKRDAAPTLLCLLRLDKNHVKSAGDAAGADAVILTGVEPGKLADVLKKVSDVAVGLRLEDGQRQTVAAAGEAGADFVLLDEESSAEAVLEQKVGLVLRADAEAGDTELRALAGLDLDALEIEQIDEPFTVRRLMALRRLALLSQTPLLIEVAPDVQPSRLEALREAGVAGVILDGNSANKLGALRKSILSLPARGRRREEGADALLPSLTGAPADEEEEPEYE